MTKNVLTPWSRVGLLREKLIVSRMVKKFSAFHESRWSVNVFTITRQKVSEFYVYHLSLMEEYFERSAEKHI